MVKPGKRDRKHSILITGPELDELKRHTLWMDESLAWMAVLTDIGVRSPSVCIAGIWNAYSMLLNWRWTMRGGIRLVMMKIIARCEISMFG